jgi:hypothetical protein
LDDVIMTSDYSLLRDALRVAYAMTYAGAHAQPLRTQETPAFFADRRLGVLAFYDGAAPWTRGALRFALPGGTNEYFVPTERRAAARAHAAAAAAAALGCGAFGASPGWGPACWGH